MKGIVLRVCLGCALLLVLAGTAEAASPNVVVSEFRFRGANGASDEFVELYNASNAPVAIGGDLVRGSNNAGTVSTRATITAGTILGPGCHYLVTNTLYVGSVPGDQTFATGITDDGGVGLTLAGPGATIDAVGLSAGSAYKEGTPLASLGTTNADNRSYERKPGGAAGNGQDTDDNSADFLVHPSDPQNSLSTCIGSTTQTNPSGTGAATPSSVDAGSATLLTVALSPGANPASTGLAASADLSSLGGSSAQQLYDDGTHGDATAGDNTFSFNETVPSGTATGAKTLPVTITDTQSRTGSASIALTVTAPTAITPIHTIQGAAQLSPLNGQQVTNVQGIVTAVVPGNGGFYMQDPNPDSDPATSEGIFVFSSTSPAVGDLVRVDARVNEFYAGGDTTGLPTTELSSSPRVSVLSHGNALPAPVIAGTGGRIPPQAIAQTGDVTQRTTFDPATDALDFWESLEGMRVQVNNAVATGPQNSFGELPVVGDDGANASARTPRGGVLLGPSNPNGERIILNDQILPTPPVVNVGDHFTTPAVGVINYDFGYYELNITAPLTRVDSGLQRETTTPAGPDELSVATFNVENLNIGDGDAKFDGLADRIVNHLLSPDIVTLEEVQDNDGPTDDGVVNSDATLDKLVQAISAAGGPTYSYTYIAPDNDQDGGEPGGNIRIAFLYNTAAGVSLPAGATKGDSDTADSVTTDASGKPHLALDPGRIDPTSSAWAASRKPLAGEFLFLGKTFFVIGNHFDAKLGDDPLTGRYQPPAEPSAVQRHQQAQIVHDFVAQIVGDDPNANVIVLGDLNDFQFSETDHILEGSSTGTPILTDMIDTLPANEQYSYVYEGNSEVLDHILVSHAISAGTRTFDVVHINAEFQDQLSDHDPSVLHVLADRPPVVSAGGPYTVAEGGTTTLTATGSDPDGDDLTYTWDVNGQHLTGQSVTFDASNLDGPSDVQVTVTASDGSQSSSDTTTVHITNVPPTATFNAPSQAVAGSSFTISLSAPSDPSSADTAASFTYAFDCGSGFGPYSSASSATCVAGAPGTQPVGGRIQDKDGGVTTYTANVQVTVTPAAICTLTVRYIESSAKYKGLPPLARKVVDALAQAACAEIAKLPTSEKPAVKAAAVKAFTKAVNALAQAGWLTAAQAAELVKDAQAL